MSPDRPISNAQLVRVHKSQVYLLANGVACVVLRERARMEPVYLRGAAPGGVLLRQAFLEFASFELKTTLLQSNVDALQIVNGRFNCRKAASQSNSTSVSVIQRRSVAALVCGQPGRDASKYYVLWSWRRESNPRPSDYKSDALPTELRQPTHVNRRLILPLGGQRPSRR